MPSALTPAPPAQRRRRRISAAQRPSIITVVLALIAGASYGYANLRPNGENGEEVM